MNKQQQEKFDKSIKELPINSVLDMLEERITTEEKKKLFLDILDKLKPHLDENEQRCLLNKEPDFFSTMPNVGLLEKRVVVTEEYNV